MVDGSESVGQKSSSGASQRNSADCYSASEFRIVRAMIECALEGGLSHTDAVRLGIAVYKEVDLLARGTDHRPLKASSIREIRLYARAVLRSGSTFSAYDIATRAVNAYKLAQSEIGKLKNGWRRDEIGSRLKKRDRNRRYQEACKVNREIYGEQGDSLDSGSAILDVDDLVPGIEDVKELAWRMNGDED